MFLVFTNVCFCSLKNIYHSWKCVARNSYIFFIYEYLFVKNTFLEQINKQKWHFTYTKSKCSVYIIIDIFLIWILLSPYDLKIINKKNIVWVIVVICSNSNVVLSIKLNFNTLPDPCLILPFCFVLFPLISICIYCYY